MHTSGTVNAVQLEHGPYLISPGFVLWVDQTVTGEEMTACRDKTEWKTMGIGQRVTNSLGTSAEGERASEQKPRETF